MELAGSGSVVTAVNDVDGRVAFPALSFDAPGTYTYELHELDAAAPGLTYDNARYRVRIEVRDDGAGSLVADVAVNDAQGSPVEGGVPVFKNAYEPAPVAVDLLATKILTGRELTDGEFVFELIGEDGSVLQTVRNDAAGQVAFEPLSIDAAGLADAPWVGEDDALVRSRVFTYLVREVVPDDAVNAVGVRWADAGADERAAGGFAKDGVTYDGRVFTATVTVSDDGSGELVASVAWDGEPVFENAYGEPGEPDGPDGPQEPVEPNHPSGQDEPSVPDDPATPPNAPSASEKLPGTGDNALVVPLLCAALGMLAVALGIWRARRSRAQR